MKFEPFMVQRKRGEVVLLKTMRAQVGDIILTLGPTPVSTLLAAAGGGPFSHAALWTGSALYESMKFRGVGAIALPAVKRCEHDLMEPLENSAGLLLLPPARKYLCLRHPNIFSHYERSELEQLLLAVANFSQYPKPSNLLDASHLPEAIRKFAKRVLEKFEDVSGGSRANRGPFCSQLVTMFFQEAEVPLFSNDRTPETVGPNHLLESLLEPVPDVLISMKAADVSEFENDGTAAVLQELSPDRVREQVDMMTRMSEIKEESAQLTATPPQSPQELIEKGRRLIELTQELNKLLTRSFDDMTKGDKEREELLRAFADLPEIKDVMERGQKEFSMPMIVIESKDSLDGAPLKETAEPGAQTIRNVVAGTRVMTHLQGADRWLVRLDDGMQGYVSRRLLQPE